MLITLTTDFGYIDPFAGVMKGVIRGINPSVEIIDITHGVKPHDIAGAALVLDRSFRYFPHRSIHIVVIDPGVGSARRPILIETDEYFFIGPDNGVFTPVFRSAPGMLNVIHLTEAHYFLPPTGSTFHGRDIFAPVAAWVSRGIGLDKMGEPITDYVTIDLSRPKTEELSIEGEIVLIDGFGNAETNISQSELDRVYSMNPSSGIEVVIKGRAATLRSFYAECPTEDLCSLINSNGNLELYKFSGSASADFGLGVGDKVIVKLKESA